jgi:hypothetical protein
MVAIFALTVELDRPGLYTRSGSHSSRRGSPEDKQAFEKRFQSVMLGSDDAPP